MIWDLFLFCISYSLRSNSGACQAASWFGFFSLVFCCWFIAGKLDEEVENWVRAWGRAQVLGREGRDCHVGVFFFSFFLIFIFVCG